MNTNDRIVISGAPGSPYTRKMLAVLRYRQIPYRFIPPRGPALAGLPKPKVQLLPTFFLPDAHGKLQAVVDSTPIIRRLELAYPARGLLAADPAICFLDELIEDYADEWLTKAMFHYRWSYPADIKQAGETLPCWTGVSMPDDEWRERSKLIRERQIARLHVVGSNAVTGPLIEASYRRFLGVFEAHLREHPYLLGQRPGVADFAVYGQLTQLANFDPTPMALTRSIAPRVYAWVLMLEDLSGVEPGDNAWFAADRLPATLLALLHEIGRAYPAVMLANARALAHGAAQVEAEVEGQLWAQPPFPYQAKCLHALRTAHAALPARSRAQADEALRGTGCAALFA